MKYLKYVLLFALLSGNGSVIKSQHPAVIVGTDIPYQFFAGVSLETKHVTVPLKTGILIPPYSDVVLSLLEELGTKAAYIHMLESAYQFGWMNSLGAQYKFGPGGKWYAGFEFRLDYLTAADTPVELFESVIGTHVGFVPGIVNVEVGLHTYATGIRAGRSFAFGRNDLHCIKIELAALSMFLPALT